MLQQCSRLFVLLVFIGAPALTCGSIAQQQSTQDQGTAQTTQTLGDNETYRLRTFVSRIQIPTLVLTRSGKPVPGLESNSFDISLDSGPAFHPTHSRVEGDDPLSLTILIDAAGSQPKVIAKLADALATLVPNSLYPTDHISIYAADCTMYRTRLFKPADAEDIRLGVQQVLTALHPANEKRPVHCGGSFHLWNFAMFTFAQTGNQPGRRVALLISGGHESHSSVSLVQASRLAGRHAISVFGLRASSETDPFNGSVSTTYRPNEDPFEILCAANGGMVFNINPSKLSEELANFLTIVRSRYILEFPQPDKGETGLHEIVVTVPSNKRLLVRPAGASSIPIDAAIKNDPNTVPSQASPAVFGTRRPMDTAKH